MLSVRNCAALGLVGLLFAPGASLSAAARAPSRDREAALRWAARLVREVHNGDGDPGVRGGYARMQFKEAGDAYRQVLRKFGPNAEALAGLGHCLEQLGKFDAAVDAYGHGVRMAPHNQHIFRALSRVRECRRIAGAVGDLPDGDQVLQVIRLPYSGRHTVWAVLSASVDEPDSMSAIGGKLYLVEDGLDGCRVTASETLGSDDDAGGNDVYLAQRRVTGKRRPELVTTWTGSGAGFAPAHVVVWDTSGGRLRKLFGGYSNDSILMTDLGHDGHTRLGLTHEIGLTLAHAGQPRWTDYWGWTGDGWGNVNRQYPREFRDWRRELGKARRESLLEQRDRWARPGVREVVIRDPELLQYQGTVEEILGNPAGARRFYNQSLAEWVRWRKRHSDERSAQATAEVRKLITHLKR